MERDSCSIRTRVLKDKNLAGIVKKNYTNKYAFTQGESTLSVIKKNRQVLEWTTLI